MKIIFGGHYDTAPNGWVAYSEQEQDMTQPLKQEDNSIDTVYSEHCVEHLPFEGAISFFKESKRVLKNRGILRIICPFIDQLVEFKDDQTELNRNFVKTQLSHYYQNEKTILDAMGVDFYNHGQPFLFDSLLKGHNHRFVWSTDLMYEVLENIGYSEVYVTSPGKSKWDKSNCIERKIRGLHLAELTEQGVKIPQTYDPESLVVEAKK